MLDVQTMYNISVPMHVCILYYVCACVFKLMQYTKLLVHDEYVNVDKYRCMRFITKWQSSPKNRTDHKRWYVTTDILPILLEPIWNTYDRVNCVANDFNTHAIIVMLQNKKITLGNHFYTSFWSCLLRGVDNSMCLKAQINFI